jgi:membrane protein
LPAARTVGRVHQDDERESGISGKAVTAVATDGPRLAVRRFRARLAALRERHEWLAHLTRAGARYIEQRGNHFAAAITFFSILTAVPLLMVAFAAAGYVLWFNPELLTNLENSIAASVPAGLFDALNPIIETAIGQRNTVAGVGLVAALWSGIWWMSNLREAVSAQWGLPPPHPAALQRLAYDLVALVGLGGALVASLLVTLVGTGVGETALRFAGLADDGWTPTLLRGLSIAVGLVANWLMFLWAITRLPRTDVPMRGAARAALLGAVGFEVLKQGAATYLESVTTSASGAVFGSLLGLLLFTYIVARLVLGVTAWAATARGNERPYPIPPPVPAVIRPQVVARAEQPAATAGALGVAALIGVLVGAWLGGRTPGSRRSGAGRQPGGRGRNGS